MRRQIIILFVLLATAMAWGGYPDEYYGPPLPEGCSDVEAYVPSGGFLDRNPWSMPSPEEGIFWFGQLCVEGPVAVLEFTQLAGRHCTPSIYNPSIDECFAWLWMNISDPDRHVMTWDPAFAPDWGFYQASVSAGDWQWYYDSLTNLGGDQRMFVEGVWEFFPPLIWEEFDGRTRWMFLVSPRTTPIFGIRHGASRVGQ